jgi:hypothetical protein
MHTHRFGRKLKLPSTIAIKHQIRKLMLEESVEKAEAGARELKQRAPSQKSPTAALYQASVGTKPIDRPRVDRAAAPPAPLLDRPPTRVTLLLHRPVHSRAVFSLG